MQVNRQDQNKKNNDFDIQRTGLFFSYVSIFLFINTPYQTVFERFMKMQLIYE